MIVLLRLAVIPHLVHRPTSVPSTREGLTPRISTRASANLKSRSIPHSRCSRLLWMSGSPASGPQLAPLSTNCPSERSDGILTDTVSSLLYQAMCNAKCNCFGPSIDLGRLAGISKITTSYTMLPGGYAARVAETSGSFICNPSLLFFYITSCTRRHKHSNLRE
jgi:hypothetical protein